MSAGIMEVLNGVATFLLYAFAILCGLAAVKQIGLTLFGSQKKRRFYGR